MSRRRRYTLAERADRHRLYERSVQDADAEIDFIKETFRRVRRRAARSLREDFCGTANLACKWVGSNPRHSAIGVDLDADVLAWGREHNLAGLSAPARKRVRLVESDVRTAPGRALDVVVALNFSYWTFKDRATLRGYFSHVRRSLALDGVLLLDAYGGYDAYRTLRERRKVGKFTYVWEQADFDPLTAHTTCHIHFSFRDGSRLKRAFSYDWRLWTLPEVRELLAEAGFSRVTLFWQGTDEKTGELNGEFEPAVRGEPDPAWIAYLLAEP